MLKDFQKKRTLAQLDRIKKTIIKYKNKSPDTIDYWVVNTNQNLSNKEIAYAYKKLGYWTLMKNTETVKRSLK